MHVRPGQVELRQRSRAGPDPSTGPVPARPATARHDNKKDCSFAKRAYCSQPPPSPTLTYLINSSQRLLSVDHGLTEHLSLPHDSPPHLRPGRRGTDGHDRRRPPADHWVVMTELRIISAARAPDPLINYGQCCGPVKLARAFCHICSGHFLWRARQAVWRASVHPWYGVNTGAFTLHRPVYTAHCYRVNIAQLLLPTAPCTAGHRTFPS